MVCDIFAGYANSNLFGFASVVWCQTGSTSGGKSRTLLIISVYEGLDAFLSHFSVRWTFSIWLCVCAMCACTAWAWAWATLPESIIFYRLNGNDVYVRFAFVFDGRLVVFRLVIVYCRIVKLSSLCMFVYMRWPNSTASMLVFTWISMFMNVPESVSLSTSLCILEKLMVMHK